MQIFLKKNADFCKIFANLALKFDFIGVLKPSVKKKENSHIQDARVIGGVMQPLSLSTAP